MIHHAPSPRLEPDHHGPEYDESDIAFLQIDVYPDNYDIFVELSPDIDWKFIKDEETRVQSIIKGEPRC